MPQVNTAKHRKVGGEQHKQDFAIEYKNIVR